MHQNADAEYLEKLESIEFTPVFILGLHRSGTSILYKLLTQTGNFNSVTAYHLIYYNQLLKDFILSQDGGSKKQLTQQLQSFSADRGIDQLKLDADFPEEYGFLLGKQSSKMCITGKNFHVFTELCKKIQFVSDNNKPILLKNPHDFSNFLRIKKLYPNARFVFIHRHPLKTVSSTIKAVQNIFTEENWYTSQLFRLYNNLFENPLLLKGVRFIFVQYAVLGIMYLCFQMRNSTRYFIRNINRLDNNDYINISYESLCLDADNIIKDVLEFLGYKTSKIVDFQAKIKPRKIKLYPGVKSLKNFIFRCLKKYFDYWDYSIDDID